MNPATPTAGEPGPPTPQGSPDAAPDEAAGGDPALRGDALVVTYERSPLDVLRLVLFATATIVVLLATRYVRDGVDGIEESITNLLQLEWHGFRLAVDLLLVSVVVVASLVVLVVPAVTRRWRVLGYVLAANVTTSLLAGGIDAWVGDLDTDSGADLTGEALDEAAEELAVDVSTGVSTTAQLIAAFTVLGPFVGRRWRRTGAWLIAAPRVSTIRAWVEWPGWTPGGRCRGSPPRTTAAGCS